MEQNKLDLLKKQHGEVYEIITIDSDGSEIKCWLRKPNRNDLRPILAMIGQDVIRANEILLNSCWLGGDERVKTDDDLFFQASSVISELISFKVGEIKKV